MSVACAICFSFSSQMFPFNVRRWFLLLFLTFYHTETEIYGKIIGCVTIARMTNPRRNTLGAWVSIHFLLSFFSLSKWFTACEWMCGSDFSQWIYKCLELNNIRFASPRMCFFLQFSRVNAFIIKCDTSDYSRCDHWLLTRCCKIIKIAKFESDCVC